MLAELRRAIETVVGRLPGVTPCRGATSPAPTPGAAATPSPERAALPGVSHVIAVSSAKGGVGKSTVAANLAVALARQGHGPGCSTRTSTGRACRSCSASTTRPRVTPEKRIEPVERDGVRLISMGFFLDEQSPVIWRGPIVMGIVRQFLRDVRVGRLDFLVVDLPPGTGDAQLTLVQQVPVTGGLVVTTPQDVALLDVGRGIAMFAQVSTPVLGVVENMSGYVCPQCGTEDPVFGQGGAQAARRPLRGAAPGAHPPGGHGAGGGRPRSPDRGGRP